MLNFSFFYKLYKEFPKINSLQKVINKIGYTTFSIYINFQEN